MESFAKEESDQQLEDIPECMTLFQYILSPFGLTLKHKTWDHIFIGITITVYSVISLTVITSFSIPTHYYISTIRILMLLIFISHLMAFLTMKRVLAKIVCMFDEICEYERKYQLKNTTFDLTLIVFLLSYILTYISFTFNALHNPIYVQMFSNNVVLLKMFYFQVSITLLFTLWCHFSFQFIISRLCYRYYMLFKTFDKTIDKYLRYRPDALLRHQIDQILNKMNKTKQSFKETVCPLNKRILIQNISPTCVLILQIFSYLIIDDINNYRYVLIVGVFIWTTCFIFTQLMIFLRIKLQNNLIFKITQWKINSLDKNYPFAGKIKCIS